jgi:hypothetical protein
MGEPDGGMIEYDLDGQVTCIESPERVINYRVTENRAGRPVPFSSSRWDVPGLFRGSAGTFELVIDQSTNRIFDLLFRSGG